MAACLGRPVNVVLGNGQSLNTVLMAIEGNTVILSGGGFLSISDITSCFPLAPTSPQSLPVPSAAEVPSPPPATTTLSHAPQIVTGGGAVAQAGLPQDVVSSPAPSAPDAPAKPSIRPEALETLRAAAAPFGEQVKAFAWKPVAVPPLPNRTCPKLDLSAAKRARALTCWTRAMDYLTNRSWAQARQQLVDFSILVPTAIEPIWGAAFAAVQQGSPVEALVLLQSRANLLPARREVVLAEVSLALQLGLLHTALRLLRAYTGPPLNLATEFLMLSCQHGLYRQVVLFLEDDPRLCESHGRSLVSFLLLEMSHLMPVDSMNELLSSGNIRPDGFMPLLHEHSKDLPSHSYSEASNMEATLSSNIEQLQEDLHDKEEGERERDIVGPYVALVEDNLRMGAYAEAMSFAVQALSVSRSRYWRERFRVLIGDVRKAQPPPTSPFQPRGQKFRTMSDALRRPVLSPKASSDAPLWQQASEAAQRNNIDQAIRYYQQFLEEEARGEWSERADKSLNGLGMLYQQQGKRQLAIETMLKYQKYVLAPLRFHNQLATLYYLVGRFEKATSHFQQAAALATVQAEKQKALKNAQNARERAEQAGINTGIESGDVNDEYAAQLSKEYWGIELTAPLRIQEVTADLDPFLAPDIDRIVKNGENIVGIQRARITRHDFDHELVRELVAKGGDQRTKQGLRSQYLASSLFIIYSQNWHQDPVARDRLNPIRIQTQFAASLGDDAAGQSRWAVAREYFACVLERNPSEPQALAKVRDYIGTFTGEVFEKYRPDRFNDLLENRSPSVSAAREQAVYGILHLANLSQPAYKAVYGILQPSHKSLLVAIQDLLSDVGVGPRPFVDLLKEGMHVVEQHQQRVYAQFQQFQSSTITINDLAGALGDALRRIDIRLPHNPLDFGHEGRLERAFRPLVRQIASYLAPLSPTEKEARYNDAKSAIEVARRDIMDHPSRFGRRTLLPVLDRWTYLLQEHYEAWEQTVTPLLGVRCEAAVPNPKKDGYVVDLLVSNARGVRTALEVHLDLQVPGWETRPQRDTEPRSLEEGQAEPQSWVLTRVANADLVGSVTAITKLTYIDRRGRQYTQELPVDVIQPIPYREVRNSYEPGLPVRTDDMLKGRRNEVLLLQQGVADRERCSFFRVIGARRVGKSSIVEAVMRQLRQDATLIVTDRLDIRTTSSKAPIGDLLQVWASALCKEGRRTARPIPEWEPTGRGPVTEDFLAWIEQQVRPLGHPVLLLDEFQGVADMFADDQLRDFLNFWKAMIERRLLSGIICGVDSMDGLIAGRGYGNQFASLQTVPIDYLKEADARELIEDPVRFSENLPSPFDNLKGKSRYTAGALKRILELTGLSPYYIQHLCYGIVNILNEEHKMIVTEMTVKQAAESLKDFSVFFESLTDFRPNFPNPRDKEIEGRVLYSIALATRDQQLCNIGAEIDTWPRSWQDEARAALHGLVGRGVVAPHQNGDLHRIRVGMFRTWLAENRAYGDRPAPQEADQ